MQDGRLLRRYVEEGSQEAFGALVAKHLGFVYAVCCREVGDSTLAEDAAQVVFLLLARKAKTIRPSVTLSTWLFQVARLTGKNIRRQEARRRAHEGRLTREGTEMGSEWPERKDTEPFLNDALACLSRADWDAVMLRYCEEHSFAETGTALGISEEAARKRVTRALDKMRRYLTAQGAVVTGGAALAGLLTAEAARSAPPAVQAAVLQAATGVLPVASKILMLAEGVTRTMGMIKTFGAAMCACAVLVGVYGGAVTVRAFSAAKQRVTVPRVVKTPPAQSVVGISSDRFLAPSNCTLTYRMVTTFDRSKAGKKDDIRIARKSYDEMVRQHLMSRQDADATLSSVIKQMMRPPYSTGDTVTVSLRDGTLLYRKQSDDGNADTVSLFDGRVSLDVDRKVMSATLREGRPRQSGLPLPMPGLGLLHLPLVQDTLAVPAGAAPVHRYSAQVLDQGLGQFTLEYRKGYVDVRVVDGSPQITEAGADLITPKLPATLWRFSNFQRLGDRWIADSLRWTRRDDYGEMYRCQFTLTDAKDTALGASQFEPATWVRPRTLIQYLSQDGPPPYVFFDPARHGSLDELYNAEEQARRVRTDHSH